MTSAANAWRLSIAEAAAHIQAGKLTPSVLVASVLDRIDKADRYVRAYVVVDRERALQTASELDAEITRGIARGPLHGVPVAIKDIFDVEGLPTKCGCRAFDDAPPVQQDSTVVERLRRAGAIIIGKTNTHELACGVYTPPTRNPWDVERIPGGSSGGSGAAVAAGMAMGATGSDTGGSIRIPAALCGLAGIKPTYGRVSRAGVAALSWSLDHVGPIARTVEDAALLLTAMAGPDPRDRSTAQESLADLLGEPGESLEGRRIGVPRELFFDGIEPAVHHAVDKARHTLADLGAVVVDVSIPELGWTLTSEFGIFMAEAASNYEDLVRTRGGLVGDDVRAALEAGTVLPAVHYLRAQRMRTGLQLAMRDVFAHGRLDALLTPTLPAVAAKHDQLVYDFDGHQEGVQTAYVRTTAPFNLTGQPVVAVQAGLSTDGLPTSVQFAGRPFDEQTVVTIARVYERATGQGRGHREPAGIAEALHTTQKQSRP